ncbi:MAG: zinc ribbon domain-containing protein [Candidatus Promineifilaceae bacterium]
MTNELLTEVACPNCRNPIDIREHGRHITCDACGSQFILRGHLCPNCNTYNEDEASICGHCGTALTRICRKCNTKNWAGDEYCRECGNAMDILDFISGNYATKTADRLLEQRQRAKAIQEIEEQDSNRRMGELMAIEEARQAEIRRRIQHQKQQERKMFILMGLAIGLFLIILILYALINLL